LPAGRYTGICGGRRKVKRYLYRSCVKMHLMISFREGLHGFHGLTLSFFREIRVILP
jgi:hypothetical protein